MATSTLDEDTDRTANRPNGAGQPTAEADANAATRIDALAAWMKAHPLLSIAIGMGVGYLLARIVDRD